MPHLHGVILTPPFRQNPKSSPCSLHPDGPRTTQLPSCAQQPPKPSLVSHLAQPLFLSLSEQSRFTLPSSPLILHGCPGAGDISIPNTCRASHPPHHQLSPSTHQHIFPPSPPLLPFTPTPHLSNHFTVHFIILKALKVNDRDSITPIPVIPQSHIQMLLCPGPSAELWPKLCFMLPFFKVQLAPLHSVSSANLIT